MPKPPANPDRAGNDPGASEPQCLVVMYHYVRGANDPQPLRSEGMVGLEPAAFEAQLEGLSAQFEPIDWPTLYAWMQGQGRIPARSFLLTFDDGLADHARAVLPILERRGLRGVFFVPGEALDTEQLLCAHAIHLLLSLLGAELFECELVRHLQTHVEHKDWLAEVDVEAAHAMYHYENQRRARLKFLLTVELPVAVRRAAVEALFAQHIGSSKRWARTWYLDWNQLAEMTSAGHTIGGHGYLHEPYTRLTRAQQRVDARRTAELFDEGLGPDLRPFSYPYGCYHDEAVAAVAGAGFVQAFTTERRILASGDRAFALPRFDTIHVDAQLGQELRPCPQA